MSSRSLLISFIFLAAITAGALYYSRPLKSPTASFTANSAPPREAPKASEGINIDFESPLPANTVAETSKPALTSTEPPRHLQSIPAKHLASIEDETDPANAIHTWRQFATLHADHPVSDTLLFETGFKLLPKDSPEFNHIAVSLLSNINSPTRGMMHELLDAVYTGRTIPEKISALSVLENWQADQNSISGEISESLLNVAEESSDAPVRAAAMQMLASREAPPSDDEIARSTRILIQDSDPSVRAAVALLISDSEQPAWKAFAIQALEEAYRAETDERAKETYLHHIAEIGNETPKEVVERLSGLPPTTAGE